MENDPLWETLSSGLQSDAWQKGTRITDSYAQKLTEHEIPPDMIIILGILQSVAMALRKKMSKEVHMELVSELWDYYQEKYDLNSL